MFFFQWNSELNLSLKSIVNVCRNVKEQYFNITVALFQWSSLHNQNSRNIAIVYLAVSVQNTTWPHPMHIMLIISLGWTSWVTVDLTIWKKLEDYRYKICNRSFDKVAYFASYICNLTIEIYKWGLFDEVHLPQSPCSLITPIREANL